MRLGKIDSRVYKLCLVGLACLAGGLGAVSCRPHRVIRIRVPAAVLSAMEASQVDAVDAAGSIATPASANPTDGNRYANLPAFQPGAVIELPAGTVPINRLSAVDSAFRQRYITGNPLMRPVLLGPLFLLGHHRRAGPAGARHRFGAGRRRPSSLPAIPALF